MNATPAHKSTFRILHIRLASGIVLATYALIVVVTSIQVFCRYVLSYSLPWSEELARYAFMWLIYASIVIGLHRGAHACVDVLVARCSGMSKKVLLFKIHAISLALFAVLFWQGLQLFFMVKGQSSPAMRISMTIPYASLPFGSLLMIIEELCIIWEVLTAKEEGR